MSHRYWANVGVLSMAEWRCWSKRKRKRARQTMERLGWKMSRVADCWYDPAVFADGSAVPA